MTPHPRCAAAICGLLLAAAFMQPAAMQSPAPRRGGGRGGQGAPRMATFTTAVPDHPLDVVLARPAAESITLSILFYRDRRARVCRAPGSGASETCTELQSFRAGEPVPVVLGALRADTRYTYVIRASDGGGTPEVALASGEFHTQRAPGRAFTFTITADSHLDERTDGRAYARSLRAAAMDHPDFHVDLGDTFMTERHPDRPSAARQYLAQRYYFGLLAEASPIFLALGNHDGEGARRRPGGDDSAAWALDMRRRYFPNPIADGFYSGNTALGPGGGPLEDYYAWRWGDARFIVLDPFWYSARAGDDGWNWTLGAEQYQWLERILASSAARFTFVFIHHLVGGADRQARGGAEASRFYEWGGANADGAPGFDARRPGWALPIHDLLARYRVTAVFHGHDHLYARQERDGLIYQAVPQPGDARGGSARSAREYGYLSGTILGGAGYLRVHVTPGEAMVEYVDTVSAATGRIAHQYTVRPSSTAAGPR